MQNSLIILLLAYPAILDAKRGRGHSRQHISSTADEQCPHS